MYNTMVYIVIFPGGRSLGEEVLSEPRRSIRERERKEREEKRYDMTPPATTPLTPLYYDFDDALSRWTFAALLALPFLSVVSAPYGRFFTSNWGPAVPGRIGWMIQESVVQSRRCIFTHLSRRSRAFGVYQRRRKRRRVPLRRMRIDGRSDVVYALRPPSDRVAPEKNDWKDRRRVAQSSRYA